MQAAELWGKFIQLHPEHKEARYEAWSYGVLPDELAELTQKEIKTATTSGFALYELEEEALPVENEYNVILDGDDQAICITVTTKVYVTPFEEVTERHAYKEGEGDRTLDYWRKVHIDFFTEAYQESNLVFNEQSLVVCEEFEKVFEGIGESHI